MGQQLGVFLKSEVYFSELIRVILCDFRIFGAVFYLRASLKLILASLEIILQVQRLCTHFLLGNPLSSIASGR